MLNIPPLESYTSVGLYISFLEAPLYSLTRSLWYNTEHTSTGNTKQALGYYISMLLCMDANLSQIHCKALAWINEQPCLELDKLKSLRGRKRADSIRRGPQPWYANF